MRTLGGGVKAYGIILFCKRYLSPFISALRAAFGSCAPKRACGRRVTFGDSSPQGEPFLLLVKLQFTYPKEDFL